jgi:hypothetical protein
MVLHVTILTLDSKVLITVALPQTLITSPRQLMVPHSKGYIDNKTIMDNET